MTKTKLIILRGNSGSGKSSVARELRIRMGYGTALIEQDYIRRILLREKDLPHQPNIALIEQTAHFALQQNYNVIVEGIMAASRYGEMLQRLIKECGGGAYVYYFDIPFDETLKRHETKSNAHEFGEPLMRELFQPYDILGVKNEQIIPVESTFEQTVERILKDISV